MARDRRVHSRWLERARQLALGAVLLGALAFFARFVDQFYPLRDWLFWRYATYWACCAGWSLACFSAGNLVVTRALGRGLGLLERLALAFPVGVFAFELLMWALGMLHLYGAPLFYLAPLALFVAGAVPFWKSTRRAVRHLRAARRRAPRPPVWHYALIALGCLALLMVYLPVLLPGNIHFDSLWRHMVFADDYVASGGIHRSAEGWVCLAAPQFGSMIYTWAFLLPGSVLFDRMELAQHLAFTVFAWTTLLGIPAIVRRLVPRARPSLVWTVRFAFPAIFLYDSSVNGGVDHIGAMFAVPLFLLLLMSWRRLALRPCLLFGAMLGAAACNKETTGLLLVPVPALALVARALWLEGRTLLGRGESRRRFAALGAALAAGAVSLACFAPHWATNLIWYGDPLYPTLNRWFHDRPWSPDAAYAFQWAIVNGLWHARHDWSGVKNGLEALVTFSFVPHDWPAFHRDVPVFGSLFTLLLAALPFFRKTLRIWALVLWVELGVFTWYWVNHEDRYLQTLMPLIAAVTAAIAIRIWRLRHAWPVRGALVALIGLQVVWGGDVYFFPTHAMLGTAPIKAVADLLASGYERRYAQRFDVLGGMVAIGKALPRGSKLLLHEQHVHLGLGVPAVMDGYGEVYGLDYHLLDTPARVCRRLRSFGVTHLAWSSSSPGNSPLGDDVAFFRFARLYTTNLGRVSGFWLGKMPRSCALPAPAPSDDVLVVTCGRGGYSSGLYAVKDLKVPLFGPRRREHPSPLEGVRAGPDLVRLAARANTIALDPRCRGPRRPPLEDFILAENRRGVNGAPKYQIYLREQR